MRFQPSRARKSVSALKVIRAAARIGYAVQPRLVLQQQLRVSRQPPARLIRVLCSTRRTAPPSPSPLRPAPQPSLRSSRAKCLRADRRRSCSIATCVQRSALAPLRACRQSSPPLAPTPCGTRATWQFGRSSSSPWRSRIQSLPPRGPQSIPRSSIAARKSTPAASANPTSSTAVAPASSNALAVNRERHKPGRRGVNHVRRKLQARQRIASGRNLRSRAAFLLQPFHQQPDQPLIRVLEMYRNLVQILEQHFQVRRCSLTKSLLNAVPSAPAATAAHAARFASSASVASISSRIRQSPVRALRAGTETLPAPHPGTPGPSNPPHDSRALPPAPPPCARSISFRSRRPSGRAQSPLSTPRC